ncbi:MAG: hypothetical protein BWY04_00499 [candidate division CPR1 bacterium ADurb.Bin160]|uniref:Uncharacterized protein n=1 Tax=candidate division CPR1 bacterium ADurb.Bin160 TaxID=1852826 RepID=A0A1V5ZP49_9BACT|nr:MAG: hypothetical protein BWY04_00499 [candidate division CPR1 bacterium ADurb.Bin160]
MKKINFFCLNKEKIEFFDEDDKTILDEYSLNIASALENNEITIFKTKNMNLIVRPSKIYAISIENVDENTEKEQKNKEDNNINETGNIR